ncbi:restriction endonuclease subunit S [Faecalibacterium sp. I4-3-84]|jgi:type I restriction enzyme S subunit|uniref:restriction endonuclease subunit S n=1 Tax=Faecalibacterium sp. I4-3-84 TaxID=2929495 RepID=UPI002014E1B9|nr:restriction endonuclease subunit S [Faecalibacterium sp. I4-3-84]UQK36845.1 restriction endonuclease subunit S [Faecalibacterium sp. I4-3-84]
MGKEIELSTAITDIAAGPFGSNLKVECFVPSGFPIIDGANLKGYKVTDNITKFVTEEKARSLSRSIAHRGDVIVTISGTIGQIAYIPENSLYDEYLCSQRQFRVSFDSSMVYVPYLVFYFHTFEGQNKILSFANQTGVPALSQPLKNFKKIRLCLPSLQEQRRIASIVETINDKIENNIKINDNLQQQAQAIYSSMFIDNPDPAWSHGHLSDLITVKYGKDHKKLADGIYPVYGSGGIMRYVERPLYNKESVLIPRKGTLNNVMYVNQPFWSVDTMFYTEMKLPNVAKFVYHFVKAKDLASMNAGSAVPSMTTDILNAMEVVIPSASALEEFESLVAPMYEAMEANDVQSKALSQMRDTLLPKLMSGEIDVSDIQL